MSGRGSGRDGSDAVFGEGGEVGQECPEAVDGQPLGSALAGGLGARGGRGSRGRDGRGALGLGGVGVVVVEEQRGEGASHVPLDVIGEHAEEDVGPHAPLEAVVDGTDLEVDALEASEGALHAAEALVGADHVPGRQFVGRARWCG